MGGNGKASAGRSGGNVAVLLTFVVLFSRGIELNREVVTAFFCCISLSLFLLVS